LQLTFSWNEGVLEIEKRTGDDESRESLAKGSREEILRRFPQFAEIIETGHNTTLSEFPSQDGRYLGILKFVDDDDADDEWEIYRVVNGARQLVKSGRAGIATGPLRHEAGLFFLADADAAVIHEDECNLTVVRLSDGMEIGKLSAAFSNHVKVKQIGPDLLAVYSADWYDVTHSIQICDYPGLAQGPWLLMGESDDQIDQPTPDPGKPSTPASPPAGTQQPSIPEAGPVAPLVTYEAEPDFLFTDRGRSLVIRQAQRDPVTLAIPPWGTRLRELLALDRQ
jgi:hypothetical protein